MNRLKVLYVDDEQLNLDLFAEVLKERFEILTAIGGKEALQFVKSHDDIHVVISDMNMPGMTGIEFITQAQRINKQIEYYILTGYEITNEIEDALSNGLIKKYFKKPFSLLEIGEEISE